MDQKLLDKAVRLGLTWLYHIEQPEDAIVANLMGFDAVVGRVCLSFVPAPGAHAHPVVTSRPKDPEYGHDGSIVNPITTNEAKQVLETLNRHGTEVIEHWKHVHAGVSWRLKQPAHPSLRAARDRYSRGCPTHKNVFCDREGCSWLHDGESRVVWPDGIRALK